MKKRIAIILACVFLIGCAGIQFKAPENPLSVLSDNMIALTGYLVAKNNPQHVGAIELWYNSFTTLDDLSLVQAKWQQGQNLLADMADDPFIKSRIKKAMASFELTYEGPKFPDEIAKYKGVADSFMEGVIVVKMLGGV